MRLQLFYEIQDFFIPSRKVQIEIIELVKNHSYWEKVKTGVAQRKSLNVTQ